MTQSEKKITRANAMDILKRFAKAYRKALGKAPGEIIIVGGGSIMLNYRFRDATQDFDVILRAATGVKDVINRFADENDLPRDWMNTDFRKTASFSDALTEVSRHYCWLNNQTLEIRTVSGVYLIAMKIIAHRLYRNDISDAIGILVEEGEKGSIFTYNEIEAAYQRLYGTVPEAEMQKLFRDLCSKDIVELKEIYNSEKKTESLVGEQMITYIEEGAAINVKNAAEVTARIREKLLRGQGE